jgi:hypothetical protein
MRGVSPTRLTVRSHLPDRLDGARESRRPGNRATFPAAERPSTNMPLPTPIRKDESNPQRPSQISAHNHSKDNVTRIRMSFVVVVLLFVALAVTATWLAYR